ncbi:MAG TPA: hypothetical protein VGX28_17160 [Frankiaceae bacterium]|nr:hypothetical protein [Frankiaceae bacterium]
MRRTAALALLLLAACGGDATPERAGTVTTSAPATPGAPVATAARLRSALLAVKDLPTGWSLVRDDDEDVDSFARGCGPLAALDEAFAGGADGAEARFGQQDELGPFVTESLASLPSAADVTARIAALRTALSRCPSFRYEDAGIAREVRVSAVPFPRLGDETLASRVTTEFEIWRLSMTVLVVRIRNHTLLLVGSTVTALNGRGPRLAPADLERIARAAVTKAGRGLP